MILEAINLGDDVDTTAAICGQLAGDGLWGEGHPGALVGAVGEVG